MSGLPLALLVVLIIIITLVIISSLLLTQEKIVRPLTPYGTILSEYNPTGSLIPIAVYFPLINLDQLSSQEDRAIINGPLNNQEIKQLFSIDPTQLEKCINWLQQYGSVWISETNTSGILLIEDNHIITMTSGKKLYSNDFSVCTQNDIFTPPYGMILSINSVYNTQAKRKNLNYFTDSLGIANYVKQPILSDFLPIQQLITVNNPDPGQEIAVLAAGTIDRQMMALASQQLGYPAEQFNNNISEVYISFNNSSPGYLVPQLSSDPQQLLPKDPEANLDAYSCCAVRPNSRVLMINVNTQDNQYSFTDPLPLFWFLDNKTFSCSLALGFSFDPQQLWRSGIETRLLSLTGKNIFQSSGDHGLTTLSNYQTFQTDFDIACPDSQHYFSNAITVGGFSVSEWQKQQGFSYYLPLQGWYSPYGTGGTGLDDEIGGADLVSFTVNSGGDFHEVITAPNIRITKPSSTSKADYGFLVASTILIMDNY